MIPPILSKDDQSCRFNPGFRTYGNRWSINLGRPSPRAGSQRKSRRRRSRQSIERLESRMLLTAPTVTSVSLVIAVPTNATTVSWTATFSQAVTGVDPTDFQLVKAASVGATLTQVTPVSSSVYKVTVSGIAGNGTLGLNLINDGTINSSGTSLSGGTFTGQVETLLLRRLLSSGAD